MTEHSMLGYYRFPTLYADTIIFTAEGDLWRVPATGGTAQRLTTHHGLESCPAVSPDGSRIAFSAQYEGATEVYTMGIHGGLPTRHTYEDGYALVVGWTPDGRILYSTSYFSTLPNTQLATVDPATGRTEPLPLNQASDGTFTPDGQTLFFTRLPFQGSNAKRYRGGTAQNIWKFELGALPSTPAQTNGSEHPAPAHPEAVPLTADYAGTSKTPMWWNGRVYFASDRDHSMNLWSMREDGSDLIQHTFYREWDIHSPSLHEGRIVYQLGADLYIFDISAGTDTLVPITLASDFDQSRERWIKNPMTYLSSAHLSPRGNRIALTVRGRVFVAPAEQGRLVEVTRHRNVRYRHAQFLPDGRSLLVLSDETGEQEFWRVPANGIGEPEQLTHNGTVFRYSGVPSPDGKWFAYDDKDFQLWLVHVEDSTTTRIAVSQNGAFYSLSWSPDSRWLAYVEYADNKYPQIKLYGLDERNTIEVTSDRVDSYEPVWSPDGKWLYFLSDRHFYSRVASPWGPRQPEPYFERTTKIYMVSLQAGERSPFRPADELHEPEVQPEPPAPESRRAQPVPPVEKPGAEKEQSAQAENETEPEDDKDEQKSNAAEQKVESASAEQPAQQNGEKTTRIQIDVEGLQDRVILVPVSPSNYARLAATEKHLYWTERSNPPNAKTRLVALPIRRVRAIPKTVLDDIRGYELSQNRKRVLVRRSDSLYVLNADGEPPKKLADHRVNLSRWTFSISPREEWQQIFAEAWRLERDYFYDRGMHGVEWRALRDQHMPLVDRVRDRDELNDLIGQMIGELSALHTKAYAGDQRSGTDRIWLGALGARLARDEDAGGYRIEHIYQSEPDYPESRSPLLRPDLKIAQGDIIEAINGVNTLDIRHPALLLKNQVGQQVLLSVRSPADDSRSQQIVEPISSGAERDLRYSEWEYLNRLRVDEWSNQQIGYVHLRAMSRENFSEWVRNFYPVFDRAGLIIDVRHNRGGNIDSWILEKLLRRAWFYWQPRVGRPYWSMQYAFRGHMAVICNERTASDGEAFTEGFRRLGLGKVFGTRTWGGAIWLSRNTGLVDHGIAATAQTGMYSEEGEWLIEGHGVDPDVVVDNLPHATFRGEDAQLRATVDYLLEQIRQQPVHVPQPPSYPHKAMPTLDPDLLDGPMIDEPVSDEPLMGDGLEE